MESICSTAHGCVSHLRADTTRKAIMEKMGPVGGHRCRLRVKVKVKVKVNNVLSHVSKEDVCMNVGPNIRQTLSGSTNYRDAVTVFTHVHFGNTQIAFTVQCHGSHRSSVRTISLSLSPLQLGHHDSE